MLDIPLASQRQKVCILLSIHELCIRLWITSKWAVEIRQHQKTDKRLNPTRIVALPDPRQQTYAARMSAAAAANMKAHSISALLNAVT